MIELYDEVANALQSMNRRNGSKIKPEDVRAAVVALRGSQFIFESRNPGQFAILKSMRTALEPHFELSGSNLIVNDTEGYVTLVPSHDVSRLSLTVEETLILLTLRWIYETKVELREVEAGDVVITHEAEIQQWFETQTGRTWPKRQTVRATLELLEKRSFLSTTFDSENNKLFLLKSILRHATGSAYISRLNDFLNAKNLTKDETPPAENADAETVEEGIM